MAGEAVWVALYVGLGAAFADDILALADLLGSASGLLAALAVAGALALWLRAALRTSGAFVTTALPRPPARPISSPC